MQDYLSVTVKEYLEELSARKIVPGGGSAAALTAALGAGLNLMVIDYSTKSGEELLADLKKKQESSMNRLTELVDEDCKVFSSLMQALAEKQPAEEKYIASADIPLEICRECRKSIEVTVALREKGNKSLASDVECALHILKAGFNAARLNVEVNLRHINNEGFVKSAAEELNKLNSDIESMTGE